MGSDSSGRQAAAPVAKKPNPKKAWMIVGYEVTMSENLRALRLPLHPRLPLQTIGNAAVEGRVLHARQQCDVFLSRVSGPDDIMLEHLVPSWETDPNAAGLRTEVDALKGKYGTAGQRGSPCWIFNKMMAHPTLYRGKGRSYLRPLNVVEPRLARIVAHIERIAGKRFERF
jgi:hypothetical protein